MQISKFGTLGAEVVGVDVRRLSDQDFSAIYQAWLDCNVLVVRDQRFEEHAASRVPRDYCSRGE